jgi:hypothetical protein
MNIDIKLVCPECNDNMIHYADTASPGEFLFLVCFACRAAVFVGVHHHKEAWPYLEQIDERGTKL